MSQVERRIPDWNATAAQDRDYHRRQFREPYRSTVHLARFIRDVIPEPNGEALDVGCGAGANIFHLSREFPGYRWTGVDIAGEVLFPIGRERFAERGIDARLIEGDFYKLTEIVPERRFDLVLSAQTLQVIPDPDAALDQLLAVTRGWLFVTGLFTAHDVDAQIAVKDYTWPEGVQGPYFYNVYSLPRFETRCMKHGAVEIRSRDFEIDIDLPEPVNEGMKTYTKPALDGRRLQFSGPIYEPWKFIAVRMGDR